MHTNQRLVIQSKFLRTILSTKGVQNIGAVNSCMAQSSRRRISPQNPPLPSFCAASIFPYKSTIFPTVKSLAHNLIHKRCAEHRMSVVAQYLALIEDCCGKSRSGTVPAAIRTAENVIYPRFHRLPIFSALGIFL